MVKGEHHEKKTVWKMEGMEGALDRGEKGNLVDKDGPET